MTGVPVLYPSSKVNLMKGIDTKRQSYFYSVVPEFFLCYSYKVKCNVYLRFISVESKF